MVDTLFAWVFGLNRALVWFGGGLVCAAIYLGAVPGSDSSIQNRDRAMVASGFVIILPAVLIWLGPMFLAVWVAGCGGNGVGRGRRMPTVGKLGNSERPPSDDYSSRPPPACAQAGTSYRENSPAWRLRREHRRCKIT
jgi:hypothetical protein